MCIRDRYYGDRNGALRDPFGHVWIVGTQIESLTPEQIEARMQALRVATG